MEKMDKITWQGSSGNGGNNKCYWDIHGGSSGTEHDSFTNSFYKPIQILLEIVAFAVMVTALHSFFAL
jgi:hypothetical protein